ncbi:uncharacterized protein BO80DRAFT_453336 [Aspergillus ibericus CBS 121593]|uniref:Transcription factor domain-containing protein n=1 Tax=Aspergillus ibericus CBS 121593 TaxID=1448316 RepID=A0A395H6G2_9EURO|nr:hypothetical protein BO80DRAFT_453336 [Aspergillus ibericus CBS 121593]RAL03123.1 hypothetical protein BO80DRAFT_453336 [Aspergillus ibericus CBS 121593]
MGKFAGFRCHAQGVDTFIRAHFHTIVASHLGCELTAAWIMARNHNCQSGLPLSPEIANILQSVNARRARVTSILCESYRISSIALLQLAPYGARQSLHSSVEQCLASLQTESSKLDDWHSALPQSELPIDPSFASFQAASHSQEFIRPLLFTSHLLAMNYAYYLSGRIMQCTALFHPHSHLRLDRQTCLRENVYSIGISSLLACCVLRCHEMTFIKWVENWLRGWRELDTLEEGSFPIAQALEVTRLVREEKDAGNEVYAVALPEDDGGGGGKFTSYCSQQFDRLVLVGRRSDTGRLYSEMVPVWIG